MRKHKIHYALLFAAVVALVIRFYFPSILRAMEKPGGFPSRPMTMIVPFGAGGGSDQVARAMATSLEKIVKVPIMVVNKPGGGGVAGFQDWLLSRPDGYTLLQTSDDVVTLYASGVIKENPTVDWFPICIAQITFSQIYVRPKDNRFPEWEAFLKYAKENPEKITMGNITHKGSMEQVSMYLLEKEIGFKVTQISFDKPVERYGALVGGHTDCLFEQPGDVRAYLESNDMKPILTLMRERPKAFSDTPCLEDIGAKMSPIFRFRGFYGRKGMPKDRLKYLEWAFHKAWESESFQKFNRRKYMHLMYCYRNIEDGKKLIQIVVDNYKSVYKEIGIGK